MNTTEIIDQIDARIGALEQAKTLLTGKVTRRKAGRPKKSAVLSFNFGSSVPRKRTLSAAARKRIAAAQKKRWAAVRAAKKKATA